MTRQAVVWRFGACHLHTLRRELRVNGVPRTLAPKVYELLLFLLRYRARVVTRDELQLALWPGASPSGSVVARTVMKLRRAIADDDRQRPLIQSVRGVGYRFAGEVQPVAANHTSHTTNTSDGALPLVSGDAFIRQAFARATALFQLRQWHEAQLLFDVVCAAEPDNPMARAARADNLAACGSVSACENLHTNHTPRLKDGKRSTA